MKKLWSFLMLGTGIGFAFLSMILSEGQEIIPIIQWGKQEPSTQYIFSVISIGLGLICLLIGVILSWNANKGTN